MSGRPKHTKKDANQAQIVAELRALGFDVDIIADLPGLYDLVVSGDKIVISDLNAWVYVPASVRVEIKQPGKDLSESEALYAAMQHHPDTLIKAHSTEDVLGWFNARWGVEDAD